jgi:lipopolysaccharide transport protein LptA
MFYTYILLTVLAAPTAVPPVDRPSLEIRAERMEVNQKTGKVSFTGDVKAQRGKLLFRCGHLEALYKDGKLLTMTASQDIRVKSTDFEAQARQASFDQTKGILILTGRPKLIRGKSMIQGKRIRIWIDDEKVIVDKAQAVLEPGLLNSLQKRKR